MQRQDEQRSTDGVDAKLKLSELESGPGLRYASRPFYLCIWGEGRSPCFADNLPVMANVTVVPCGVTSADTSEAR